MKYTHIFWDWNGTLVDDVDCALKAVNDILAKRDREPITKKQYYSYIDTPIKRFYEHIFDFSDITMTEIMEDFNYFYKINIGSSPLMEGAEKVLDKLEKSGLTQIVLSSSSNEMIVPYMEKTNIKRFFSYILGSSDNFVNGKIERAVEFMKNSRLNAKNCVLVGDTLHDFDTAEALGCDCILIPNGHQSRTDLEKSGAEIAYDIRFIPNIIK